jgi:hypothetical protein
MNKIRLRDEYAVFLDKWDWRVTVNLNYRSSIKRWHAEQAAQRFWNWMDRGIYGRNKVKNGRRLRRFCVIDGYEPAANWHYHCAVKMPPPEYYKGSIEEFCVLLRQRWECLNEAGKFSLCEPTKCQIAWLKYICKKEICGEGEVYLRTTAGL